MINKYLNNKKTGFTLIEMVVVVAVISILMVASIEMFSNMYSISIKTNGERVILQEARYALDTITRESRDSLELNPVCYGMLNVAPAIDCNTLGEENSINLKNKQGQDVTFKYVCTNNCNTSEEYGRIVMNVTDANGVLQPSRYLTSDNVEVVQFYIRSIEFATESEGLDRNGIYHPFFNLRIQVRAKIADKDGQKPIVTLETAITRDIYSEYSYCEIYNCDEVLFATAANVDPDIFMYNPKTNTWKSVGNLGFDQFYSGSDLAASNGNLFSAPGATHAGFYKYDVFRKTWSPVTSPPFAVIADSSSIFFKKTAIEGKLYLTRGSGYNQFAEYDITSNTWVSKANVPINVGWGSDMAVWNGKIYMTSGDIANFYSYDPSNNTWAALASMYRDAPSGCLETIGDRIYSNIFGDLRYYDPKTNTWSSSVTMTPISSNACTSVGSKMYFVTNNTTQKPQFWEYNIDNNTWTRKADFPSTGAPTSIVKGYYDGV